MGIKFASIKASQAVVHNIGVDYTKKNHTVKWAYSLSSTQVMMMKTVSAPFDKVFTQKKVRKTTNGNLVAMHQARNVELAAVEKKNLNRQF